jgi:hypothetical protein
MQQVARPVPEDCRYNLRSFISKPAIQTSLEDLDNLSDSETDSDFNGEELEPKNADDEEDSETTDDNGDVDLDVEP